MRILILITAGSSVQAYHTANIMYLQVEIRRDISTIKESKQTIRYTISESLIHLLNIPIIFPVLLSKHVDYHLHYAMNL